MNSVYIGECLGLFKIEHIFTEIAIKSSRQYVSTLDNGTNYYHCVKDSIDYNEFISEVKSLIWVIIFEKFHVKFYSLM